MTAKTGQIQVELLKTAEVREHNTRKSFQLSKQARELQAKLPRSAQVTLPPKKQEANASLDD